MRSKALRDAGVAFVIIGCIFEVTGFALLGTQDPQTILAGAALIGLGVSPFIANGAWMWPVGGALVDQDNNTVQLAVKPTVFASRDGGGFGLQLAF
jgi:hypothetical protein